MNEKASSGATPQVVAAGEALWFLGTLARVKLVGEQSAGRLGVFEVLFPRGAAPPLHSHPQDESFYVLEGSVTVWIVDTHSREVPADWVERYGRPCSVGALVYAPGGTPHTFRVESHTARMLVLSTPAGIEDYVRGLAEPAKWPWLPPPPDGPRVPAEKMHALERQLGMVRHGPPPPPAS